MILVKAILGISGTGKSTIGQLLEERNSSKYVLISPESIVNNPQLRSYDVSQDAIDEYILKNIQSGKINPLTQTLIFDGYPTTNKQVNSLTDKYQIDKFVLINVPNEICIARLKNKYDAIGQNKDFTELENTIAKERKHINEAVQTMHIYNEFSRVDIGNTIITAKNIDGNRPIELVYNQINDFFKI